jgi:glutathione synthase/RimK-type ligase-like ATP-grasp enzyme
VTSEARPREIRGVLVTDGETRAALAAVRSLGRRGLAVHVASSAPRSLAAASRRCAAEHVTPDPEQSPAAWVEAIERAVQALPQPALVLPVTEVATANLLGHGVERRRLVAAPPRAAFEIAVDKLALGERAAAAGLAVPRTRLLEQPSDFAALPEGFAYPVIVKARRSRWLDAAAWRRGGVHVVRDAEALRRLESAPDLGGGALLQELVPGHGEGLFFLADRGETRVVFSHRRLREKPPHGGVSVLCEAAPPDPLAAEAGARLLKDLGWHGVAMLELRRAPDGTGYVMELNPRLWGSLQLAIDAGVDFPALLVDLVRGAPIATPTPRYGVRTRWLLGDVDHLWLALRDADERRSTGRTRSRVLLDFARAFVDGARLEVLRWDDPRPFLRELAAWLRALRRS